MFLWRMRHRTFQESVSYERNRLNSTLQTGTHSEIMKKPKVRHLVNNGMNNCLVCNGKKVVAAVTFTVDDDKSLAVLRNTLLRFVLSVEKRGSVIV